MSRPPSRQTASFLSIHGKPKRRKRSEATTHTHTHTERERERERGHLNIPSHTKGHLEKTHTHPFAVLGDNLKERLMYNIYVYDECTKKKKKKGRLIDGLAAPLLGSTTH